MMHGKKEKKIKKLPVDRERKKIHNYWTRSVDHGYTQHNPSDGELWGDENHDPNIIMEQARRALKPILARPEDYPPDWDKENVLTPPKPEDLLTPREYRMVFGCDSPKYQEAITEPTTVTEESLVTPIRTPTILTSNQARDVEGTIPGLSQVIVGGLLNEVLTEAMTSGDYKLPSPPPAPDSEEESSVYASADERTPCKEATPNVLWSFKKQNTFFRNIFFSKGNKKGKSDVGLAGSGGGGKKEEDPLLPITSTTPTTVEDQKREEHPSGMNGQVSDAVNAIWDFSLGDGGDTYAQGRKRQF
ncbi:PREDICTED: uncharacterized protein LOC105558609 [Vollenhovia emeryi]|uniref:uncharacterized protein LOC105558609 n=1 Tax=Vollenhovia emeryi TaxID=411798 RepID=UPI0005F52008|nr:PREDICTED: uncharacterized protein LOC105558609 [Vollenhovia emeryi]